jgi:hypothetical protein
MTLPHSPGQWGQFTVTWLLLGIAGWLLFCLIRWMVIYAQDAWDDFRYEQAMQAARERLEREAEEREARRKGATEYLNRVQGRQQDRA